MTDALPTLLLFTLGIAMLASGYRTMIAPLPNPICVGSGHVAAHLLILLRATAAQSFAAWYVADIDRSAAH
ncbi:MAG TPA: hypothetical protein VGG01_13635 [Xanthobacteraceae bacterium]